VKQELKIFNAFNDGSANEDCLNHINVGFQKGVLLRVGRHLVHFFNSSEPERSLRAETSVYIGEVARLTHFAPPALSISFTTRYEARESGHSECGLWE
jgi:hypothetical protein